MDISLAGKVALVTGPGRTSAAGIALALSRYGARVACNDLDLEAAKAAVRRISRNGGPPRRDAGSRPAWWRETGTFDARGNIPMGEPATPTDIGHCIARLSSDYARLINRVRLRGGRRRAGQVLGVHALG